MGACQLAEDDIYSFAAPRRSAPSNASALAHSVTEVALTQCQEGRSAPWRVGVLFSQSGVLAVIEETQLRATLLAIDEINRAGGVNGREIVPVIYDPQSEAQDYALCAKRLMIEDGITMIFGCYTSSSRKAVLPVVERLNGLLWYPTLYEGFEFSSNVIYTGASPNQNSVALCSYLARTYGRRFYFVGSDYVYPRQSNRVMRDLRMSNVDILTLGQYLRPSLKHLPVIRHVTPEEFAELKRYVYELGFRHVESGPLVRSSYHAADAVS